MQIVLENSCVRYVLSLDGKNLAFVDKKTDNDYCVRGPFANLKMKGKKLDSVSASFKDARLELAFAASQAKAILGVEIRESYMVFEVVSVQGEGVEEFTFLDLRLKRKGEKESLAACALALNLKTNVQELPGPSERLRATCYRRFGMTGARVGLIACPPGDLRSTMQEVILNSKDLPKSPVGGPWALDSKNNCGSYLFNFQGISEANVEDWIKLAKSLGVSQIDFHGGRSLRFGDCLPDPNTYPRGLASVKAVTHRLHQAGILAGLHTYSFFLDKQCPWVSPVPDKRLAKDATFTLARPLNPDDREIIVCESTEGMSTATGFFVRNSVTLLIDEELITYSAISKQAPYAFLGCKRGAYGTRPAQHRAGAKVHHLKECFGLFLPDGDSNLYEEVAARTARAFNEGGFDMIYLDALDGEDVVGGVENGWHYGSKFVFHLCKKLQRPAIMEMSTFHHHLWYVRSRIGAWDHPNRSHKRFVDIHVQANEECQRIFMPAHLGWWAFKTWSGPQSEPTYPDDIEYLCCKSLATDAGLSIMGVDPDTLATTPAVSRLAEVVRTYEELRINHRLPESIKRKLRGPGREFILLMDAHGGWRFRPVQYARHKVQQLAEWTSSWVVRNRFGSQQARLRIEALMSAEPYDSPNVLTLVQPGDEWSQPRTPSPKVKASLLGSSAEASPAGTASFEYCAESRLDRRFGAWTCVERVFTPPLDLGERQGMGIWVLGDGQGEILNVQLRSPEHLIPAIGEHYVDIDYEGWRYLELIEPGGERYSDYRWPYGSPYTIYRESVDYRAVKVLGLWYNNLPPGKKVRCLISPIRALPLVKATLANPAITVRGRTLTFPTQIESGSYLEFNSITDCKLYGPKGEVLMDVRPEGEPPVLIRGANHVRFSCSCMPRLKPRGKVTIISQGQPLS